MLKVVRVKKSPDWPDETWFRLFKDGELINSVLVDDEIADDFERRLIPISTANKLPPEGEDILWWRPHRYYPAWQQGRYETCEQFPPGYLTGGGTWYLCDGPHCDGPTWWMFPPPDPTTEDEK